MRAGEDRINDFLFLPQKIFLPVSRLPLHPAGGEPARGDDPQRTQLLAGRSSLSLKGGVSCFAEFSTAVGPVSFRILFATPALKALSAARHNVLARRLSTSPDIRFEMEEGNRANVDQQAMTRKQIVFPCGVEDIGSPAFHGQSISYSEFTASNGKYVCSGGGEKEKEGGGSAALVLVAAAAAAIITGALWSRRKATQDEHQLGRVAS